MKTKITFLILLISTTITFSQGFKTTWVSTTATIPTTGAGYNYSVDWGDGSAIDVNVTGDITHAFITSGVHTVEITGTFPRIYFNFQGGTNRNNITAVTQWGNIQWTSMEAAFRGCSQLEILATDAPNLSNVTSMSAMFEACQSFNQDINSWDVSNVTDMSSLFSGNYSSLSYNQPLNNWDVSNVTNMERMFAEQVAFNQPLNSWGVSNVTNMRDMFKGNRAFNQPLNNWVVSGVTNMSNMFLDTQSYLNAGFDQNISSWDVSNVTTMVGMFTNSKFNKPLAGWDVSSVIDMSYMFSGAVNFNQDLSSWDVSAVTTMNFMFSNTNSYDPVFNQNISTWDVSNVVYMTNMFEGNQSFNQDISNWNVASLLTTKSMFKDAVFNQDISSWNTQSLANVDKMFYYNTNFNQDISAWDVSNTVTFQGMFWGATSFDQNLGSWDISSVGLTTNMFTDAGLSVINYDALLAGWATLDGANGETAIPSGLYFNAGSSQYCNSAAQRTSLINDSGWTIIDAGENCSLSVDDENLSRVKIVPNPSSGKFRIDALQENVDVTIYDINGKHLFKQTNYNDGFIDSNQLSQGIYFVKITNDHLNFSKKLIIK